jgi:hypothetical protein
MNKPYNMLRNRDEFHICQPLGGGTDGPVNVLALSKDGRILYVGGSFDNAGGRVFSLQRSVFSGIQEMYHNTLFRLLITSLIVY